MNVFLMKERHMLMSKIKMTLYARSKYMLNSYFGMVGMALMP